MSGPASRIRYARSLDPACDEEAAEQENEDKWVPRKRQKPISTKDAGPSLGKKTHE